jgi:NTF2 fold immunity protein
MKLLSAVSLIIVTITACGQDYAGRTVMGPDYAKEAIKKTRGDKNFKPFYDTLITDKATAVAVAEPILYKIYGKKNIINERPYECYLINGYWYIIGTLPKNRKGGVFEIIIDSKDSKVIKLVHGK